MGTPAARHLSDRPEDIDTDAAIALFAEIQDAMGVKSKEPVVTEDWEIAPRLDHRGLRENYIQEKVFNIGDTVVHDPTGLVGEIVRKGTNHLICVTKEEYMFKSWIRDVMEYDEKTMERRMRVPGKPNTLDGTGGYLKNAMAATGTSSIKNFINKYKIKK